MLHLGKLFKWFRANQKDVAAPNLISVKILNAQRKAADYLNKNTAGWSCEKMKTILILFCLVTGNLILFIAGRAILSANGPPKPIKNERRLFRPAPLLIPESKQQEINH